jgi:phosphatidylglycerophosphatase A
VFFIPLYLQEAYPGKKDPSEIVIDEVLGQLLALIVCQTMLEMVAAFVLFRVFDIWKPWPVSWADQLGGTRAQETTGIILDDVLAGLLAAGGIKILQSYI